VLHLLSEQSLLDQTCQMLLSHLLSSCANQNLCTGWNDTPIHCAHIPTDITPTMSWFCKHRTPVAFKIWHWNISQQGQSGMQAQQTLWQCSGIKICWSWHAVTSDNLPSHTSYCSLNGSFSWRHRTSWWRWTS
jgi:hypothetical protein